jgi:pimeloyl-ACP methyl ester carboxylesterase
MVRTVVRGSGWRPGFMFEDEQLAGIEQPTLFIYGTADPTGNADIWRRVTNALPQGELRLMEGAGHHPWFEDVQQVAGWARGFLTDRPAGPAPETP